MIKKGCGCNKKQPETVIIDPVPEWEPVNPCPENTLVRIENHPDEEDLTEVLRGEELVLKFKDKVYNPMTYSGYGRVFLRKNMQPSQEECPGEMNVLTLSMFMDATGQLAEHTIFIVLYDYDLNGKFITMPLDSILLFLGGSFKNGTLVLNRTLILPLALPYNTYIKCTVTGPYMKGLMFYSEEGLRIWNGTEWVVLDGTGTIDLQSVVRELQTKVLNLITNFTQIQETLDTKSNVGHIHAIANITGLLSALNEKITSGGFRINGITIYEGDNTIPTGGGEGGSSSYTLPVASNLLLGGIKIGYLPASNTSDYPIKLGTSGTNKDKAYVTVPGFNTDGIDALFTQLTEDLNGFKRTALLKFDAIDGLQVTVQAIKESIGEDGGITLDQLETNLLQYVLTETGTAVTNILSQYWTYQNDELLRHAFSGFEAIAESDGSIASIFSKYVTKDTFNSAEIITKTNLDGAIVALLARDNADTTASIVTKVLEAVSSISLTADNIDLNTGTVNITRADENAVLVITTPIDTLFSNRTYIYPKEIRLVSYDPNSGGIASSKTEEAVLTPKSLIYNSVLTRANAELNSSGFYINRDGYANEYNGKLPYSFTSEGVTLKFKQVIAGLEGQDVTDNIMNLKRDKLVLIDNGSHGTGYLELTAKKLIFKELESSEQSILELGANTNATGSFTADGKTITVQNGIITSITTN